MGLFSKKRESKASESAVPRCACNGGAEGSVAGAAVSGEVGSVRVMDPGCKSCHQLNENTRAAVAELGLPVEVEYVTDPAAIAESGVMRMPALFIDGRLVSSGKALPVDQIKSIIQGR